MGGTKLSEAELAGRIRPDRYELAAKSEVFAFVNVRLRAVTKAIGDQLDEDVGALETRTRAYAATDYQVCREEINHLESRIRELEMSRWQRFKRWANDFIEDLVFAVTADPSEFPMDDTRVVAESPYTDAINAAAEKFQAENGVSVGDAMRTEIAEDLADNPLIAEAIEHIRAFEGEQFDPNRYSNLTTSHPCAECGTTVYPGTILREPGAPQYVELEERQGDFVAHVCIKPQHDLDAVRLQLERERLRFVDPFTRDTLGDPEE